MTDVAKADRRAQRLVDRILRPRWATTGEAVPGLTAVFLGVWLVIPFFGAFLRTGSPLTLPICALGFFLALLGAGIPFLLLSRTLPRALETRDARTVAGVIDRIRTGDWDGARSALLKARPRARAVLTDPGFQYIVAHLLKDDVRSGDSALLIQRSVARAPELSRVMLERQSSVPYEDGIRLVRGIREVYGGVHAKRSWDMDGIGWVKRAIVPVCMGIVYVRFLGILLNLYGHLFGPPVLPGERIAVVGLLTCVCLSGLFALNHFWVKTDGRSLGCLCGLSVFLFFYIIHPRDAGAAIAQAFRDGPSLVNMLLMVGGPIGLGLALRHHERGLQEISGDRPAERGGRGTREGNGGAETYERDGSGDALS